MVHIDWIIVTTLHLFGCNISYRLQYVIGFELILTCMLIHIVQGLLLFLRNWWYRSVRKTSNDVMLMHFNRPLSQLSLVFFSFCLHQSPISSFTLENDVFSMYDMFNMFSICCSDWGYHSAFWVIWVMIDAEERTGLLYENFAGAENSLNHVLLTFLDSEQEISNHCHSRYNDLTEVQSIFPNNPKEFLILTLNIQSVNAKFNNVFPVIYNLASLGLYFGAICLQKTWTSTESDFSLLQLPGYQLIHHGSKCTKHGGLMIYLNETYSYKIRNLFTNSNIREGLFIDINGGNLCRTFTIGNIYRPPHNNNNNANIQQFNSDLSPIIDIIQCENKYAVIVGDFNINLLQISERKEMVISSTWCVQIISFLK